MSPDSSPTTGEPSSSIPGLDLHRKSKTKTKQQHHNKSTSHKSKSATPAVPLPQQQQAPTSDEEELIRDMMAKRQELLKIEQKKLELQLAEARASLELQAKKIAGQNNTASAVASSSLVQVFNLPKLSEYWH